MSIRIAASRVLTQQKPSLGARAASNGKRKNSSSRATPSLDIGSLLRLQDEYASREGTPGSKHWRKAWNQLYLAIDRLEKAETLGSQTEKSRFMEAANLYYLAAKKFALAAERRRGAMRARTNARATELRYDAENFE
jgi:hypothetical protein